MLCSKHVSFLKDQQGPVTKTSHDGCLDLLTLDEAEASWCPLGIDSTHSQDKYERILFGAGFEGIKVRGMHKRVVTHQNWQQRVLTIFKLGSQINMRFCGDLQRNPAPNRPCCLAVRIRKDSSHDSRTDSCPILGTPWHAKC